MEKKIFEKGILEIVISSKDMILMDLDYTASAGPNLDGEEDPND